MSVADQLRAGPSSLKGGEERAVNDAMNATSRPGRRTALAAVVLVAAFSLLTACLSPDQDQVRIAMNNDRVAYGLGALSVQMDAQNKAQAWAQKLASENTLYHSNLPDGINVRWCSLGENVGYGPSISAIETGYMNSPGHKANILNTTWNGVGTGVAYNGDRVFTVQVFIQTC
jgi:uncharacterized protein YkwD